MRNSDASHQSGAPSKIANWLDAFIGPSVVSSTGVRAFVESSADARHSVNHDPTICSNSAAVSADFIVESDSKAANLSAQIRSSRLQKELIMLSSFNREGIEIFVTNPKGDKFAASEIDHQTSNMLLATPNGCEGESTKVSSTPIASSAFAKVSRDETDAEFSILASVQSSKCQSSFTLSEQSITFSIRPTVNFPFSPPYVQCHTKFCFPSVADGRNLVSPILQVEWAPSATFARLADQLPAFIDRVVEAVSHPEHRADFAIGTFPSTTYVGRYICDPDCSVVPCVSFPDHDTAAKASLPRCVILTDSLLIACEVRGDPVNVNMLPFGSDHSSQWQTAVKKWLFLGGVESLHMKEEQPGIVLVKFHSLPSADGSEVLPILFAGDAADFVGAIQEHLEKLGRTIDVVTC